MVYRIYKISMIILIILVGINRLISAQSEIEAKLSTNKQKPFPVRIYHHIPKYSKYKSEGESINCNSTFHLLHYTIYNPQKECEKYSSVVIGFEELMIFIHEIRSSSTPLGEMVFFLRNHFDKDTKFRVDYAEFHPNFNLEVSLRKSSTTHENHVVCVKFNCPSTESIKTVCPILTKPSIVNYDSKPYQGSWFKIGISLIIILVLAIIAVLIYLIISFYPKIEKDKLEISTYQKNPMEDNKTCNSFDAYDFLRKMDNLQPSISETYSKPVNFNASLNLSDNNDNNHSSNNNNNNNNNNKSNTSLIIVTDDGNDTIKNSSTSFKPKTTDHLEVMNNKNKTMPLIKKNHNYDSFRSVTSPEYSLMDKDLSNISSKTNPSFRSVKYIPPLKLVENEF